MRLTLQMDKCLLNFESFKMVDELLKAYNELQTTKDLHIINLKDSLFYTSYQKLYNLLSVLTLRRDYDNTELMFIANLIYKQKGSVNSIKQVLNLIKGDYSDIYIDDDLTLHMNVSFEDVKEIYLSGKYLQLLCQDLLFYKDYDVSIDSMSVKYNLIGSVDKRYAIYSVYDLNTVSVDTTIETTIEESLTDEIIDNSETELINEFGLKTKTKKIVTANENNTYTIKTITDTEKYEKIDTMTIDTYEW